MTVFENKLFENPVKVIKVFKNTELEKAFKEIDKLKQDYYLTGYIRYEAFECEFSEFPLLYFEVYDNYKTYIPSGSETFYLNPVPTVSFEEYSDAVTHIKNEIANGNTYEVNYTCDFLVPFDGDEIELYDYLLKKQKTPYNFFMKNDYDTILSFSPEMFFIQKGRHIITKPMKGTVKRGDSEQQDEILKKFLQNDEKNRAENVMIVDLLRNDLGRIAKTGTVKVSSLFDIETHKTLHQMTSQIEAELRDDIGLYEIFKAIFPCGSITGAPKISTMKIIDETEKNNREIYCGAIGLLSPDETVFSVPIRILQRHRDDKNFRYRAGGAIVWDSEIQDEWSEVLTKTRFLNDNFKIVETVKIKNGKLLFEDKHYERMKQAARHFDFKIPDKLPHNLTEQEGIARFLLDKSGKIEVEIHSIKEISTNKIRISPIIVNSQNEFLYYKTTYRPWFYDSFQKIKDGEVFDEIFFNEKGELSEGSRSNVILQLDGKLYTPPVSCGLLNGIYRQQIKNLTEKVLYKEDFNRAEKIFCVNSVRGMVEVYHDSDR